MTPLNAIVIGLSTISTVILIGVGISIAIDLYRETKQ